ncbi:DUF11 domain-containing protein [Tuwongella immobilis]|uniref:Signal peptide protein: Conserved repeat domain protein n=1 Tax=Tuwongella immobilis TaxID=692036 RepID=A0A6C2YQP9_9BACT|nr:DUF11 domain-containing protein [Tuwongella immobilis]VIP03212.1 signal peptide protein : Conserved repeat domain protein OS=Isosphaera pallida (strain ATCC 43644 / DSM 9630 / IS1B) GN=Isop_3658 PE=4 SV=1 [Tuwongella immobilis]VTS03724.1 signal peptide protein : Conserved repeat domain protein OS=Isosphaera pallida (strain ATCC 43644 / DSM 9630 / IS1B) GN=Isop_3658 PE=4 SV=1 [Tuwongella immobilis]
MNLGLLSLVLPVLAAGPLGPPPPAPVVYLRVIAPEGTKVQYHPGTPMAVARPAPSQVAVRPGYVYKLGLIDLPDDPQRPLYPSIEVYGAVRPNPQTDLSKYPVPIPFSKEEIERVRRGSLLTKVIYLEDPDFAAPVATTPDSPLQLESINEKDAIREAGERGRLMVVVRLGSRHYADEELGRMFVPGTMLLPGEAAMAPAQAPPQLDISMWGLFVDPILGPKVDGFECLTDGGDKGLRLGLDSRGRLSGLDASDSSMEYTTKSGKKVTSSNRVCVCIPRFAILNVETSPVGIHLAAGPQANLKLVGRDQLKLAKRPGRLEIGEAAQSVRDFTAMKAMIHRIGPHIFEQLIGKPVAISRSQGVSVFSKFVDVQDLTAFNEECLALTKWVAPPYPEKIGDTVTFFLRYKNLTLEPIEDVVVSDSLTARLEYIPETSRSDRASNFTVSPNEVGSSVLRWQIPGKLMPGQSGVVSFQAKIR